MTTSRTIERLGRERRKKDRKKRKDLEPLFSIEEGDEDLADSSDLEGDENLADLPEKDDTEPNFFERNRKERGLIDRIVAEYPALNSIKKLSSEIHFAISLDNVIQGLLHFLPEGHPIRKEYNGSLISFEEVLQRLREKEGIEEYHKSYNEKEFSKIMGVLEWYKVINDQKEIAHRYGFDLDAPSDVTTPTPPDSGVINSNDQSLGSKEENSITEYYIDLDYSLDVTTPTPPGSEVINSDNKGLESKEENLVSWKKAGLLICGLILLGFSIPQGNILLGQWAIEQFLLRALMVAGGAVCSLVGGYGIFSKNRAESSKKVDNEKTNDEKVNDEKANDEKANVEYKADRYDDEHVDFELRDWHGL